MPDSATPDLPAATTVVLHDAGAANIVIAWVDAGWIAGDRVYAEGPAARLWADRPRAPLRATLAAALDGADALLSGTGWASDLEHRAREAARSRGLRSAAVIDHWVNYRPRFVRDGATILPDEVWITDAFAETIARDAFPTLTVRRFANLYLDAQAAAILNSSGRDVPGDLLYVLEPARDNWGKVAPGEFQALDYLVGNLEKLGLAEGTRLRLRPHPSEPQGKYDEWIVQHGDLPIELDMSPRLSDAMARASVVAGCNSFAMAVALAAGRRTVCTLPPWAPPCVLPHDGLIHLKDLV